MTTEEIFSKIQGTLVDALGVDDEEVSPEATLVGDLGAESIDFLDIVFRLEKTFDIKVPKGALFPENLSAASENFAENGIVTEEGVEALREKMPHADIDRFALDPKVDHIQDMFTVQMLVNYVESSLLTAV